ncbi:MAG: ribosomal protein S18-alanine N-acetyltransferase [candidate division Zixibacteria bacterium]|nr:ribosomal protein S18-alanine N-acetyltransferase [candidate division Zixibacteria bacterium]
MCQKVDKIVIQKMSQEDVEEVATLEKICFSDPWKRETFMEELQLKLAIPFVVKLEEKVVGYTCLWYLDDQLEVANFAVSPDHRSKGIGEKLMKRILLEAKEKGCKSIVLRVRESNKTAINLYVKFGFVEVERRKKYYRLPTEDALTMLRTL